MKLFINVLSYLKSLQLKMIMKLMIFTIILKRFKIKYQNLNKSNKQLQKLRLLFKNLYRHLKNRKKLKNQKIYKEKLLKRNHKENL